MNKLNKSQNVFRHLPSNHPLTKLQARFSSSPIVDLPSPTPESNFKHYYKLYFKHYYKKYHKHYYKHYHKHYYKHHLPSPMPESNYSGCFFIGPPQKFVV